MVSIFLRTLLIYLLLIATVRLMGKRQIGELEVTDLVTTLLLSELAALPITDLNIPVSHALIPMVSLLFLEVASSMVLVRFPRLKGLVSDRPTVLIRGGVLRQKDLLASRISVEELLSAFRLKGVGSPDDVYSAVLEQNGQLSVLPRSAHRPATPDDLGIPTRASHIGTELIMDGQIMGENLTRIGCNELWLSERLAQSGHKSAKEILLAVYRAEEDELTLYTNN